MLSLRLENIEERFKKIEAEVSFWYPSNPVIYCVSNDCLSKRKCFSRFRERCKGVRLRWKRFSSTSRNAPKRISLGSPKNSMHWGLCLAISISCSPRRRSLSSSTSSLSMRDRCSSKSMRRSMSSLMMWRLMNYTRSWKMVVNLRRKRLPEFGHQMQIPHSRNASSMKRRLNRRGPRKIQPATTKRWTLT